MPLSPSASERESGSQPPSNCPRLSSTSGVESAFLHTLLGSHTSTPAESRQSGAIAAGGLPPGPGSVPGPGGGMPGWGRPMEAGQGEGWVPFEGGGFRSGGGRGD